MLIALILIAITAATGLSVTYLVTDDEPLLWRLCAGTVIGSAIFGTVLFLLASLFGLNYVSTAASLAVSCFPIALFWHPGIRDRFLRDRQRASGKLEGANGQKLLRFTYYAAFLLLFWLFFGRTYYELADGIYTGGSQNLGDLPFHLGAIFSFTEVNNFPPVNPSWAGARFAYPFISDLLTAGFMKLGSDVKSAMFVQNIAWAFSLLVILERFVSRLANNHLAGRLAPVLLFLSGGLGFLWFFNDYWTSGKPFLEMLWKLPQDYTINDNFRWGNSMVVLFMTQRSLLLGMPLTIIVLGHLWRVFSNADSGPDEKTSLIKRLSTAAIIGMIAGMLPLIHLHSLAVLFVVTWCLFAIQPAKWREWMAFGLGVAIIAVPELLWSMTGAASDTAKFFGWHFGWDSRKDNILWFWVKNTGALIPLVAIGLYLYWRNPAETITKKKGVAAEIQPHPILLLLFYIPFVLLFVISNIAKLAPWEWDNIKILIYWFIGSLPFVTLAIARAWQKGKVLRFAAIAAAAVLIMAGSLDVWRTITGQISMRVFDTDAINMAQQMKSKTGPRSLILNAPTYNSPVVLSGRQSLMRYSGHLSSHGIDYIPRENDVKSIYQGTGVSESLLKKYNIEYVLITPEERNTLKANEEFFRRYPIAAEAGQVRLYKVQ
jgi:hypothetical protein